MPVSQENGTTPLTFNDVVTIRELAAGLGVSRNVLYGACKKGLPFRRLGQTRIFFKPEVVAWLDGQVGAVTHRPRRAGKTLENTTQT